mmetsp:Transcript_30988/g.60837  ORF Transcript_30988/g.60837 Transcript_30988/m.60837 type:complete len:222 (-) Transcript_30988:348-1013(-)
MHRHSPSPGLTSTSSSSTSCANDATAGALKFRCFRRPFAFAWRFGFALALTIFAVASSAIGKSTDGASSSLYAPPVPVLPVLQLPGATLPFAEAAESIELLREVCLKATSEAGVSTRAMPALTRNGAFATVSSRFSGFCAIPEVHVAAGVPTLAPLPRLPTRLLPGISARGGFCVAANSDCSPAASGSSGVASGNAENAIVIPVSLDNRTCLQGVGLFRCS